MTSASVAPAKKTTNQSLSKIHNFPCLYRHDNGSYYGKKKFRGVKKVAALTTADGANITDRKLAEKALASWLTALEKPAPKGARMPFADLLTKLKKTLSGHSESTLKKVDWVRRCFDFDGPEILKTPIEEIKPSQLSEFFAARKKNLGANALNEMSRLVKNAFELAVNDEILTESPYNKVPKKTRRAKVLREPANVPSIEQCEAIVAHVRGQQFADTASKSADMLEFIHKAALGVAESLHADWNKVKWDERHLEIKRVKTGEYFRVPFYDCLEPFLRDLHKRQGSPKEGPIFTIKSPKQALYNACVRLNLPRYSPIDLRKARIAWMLRKGVAAETLAKWQGHKDNGVLIRRTYSWVISEMDNAYEKAQLAKLLEKPTSKLPKRRSKPVEV